MRIRMDKSGVGTVVEEFVLESACMRFEGKREALLPGQNGTMHLIQRKVC